MYGKEVGVNMTERWLRHTEDGFLYGWTESLAKHPKLREVSDEEAFPEKYMPTETTARITKGRAKPVKVEAPVVPEKPLMSTEEILQSFKDDAPVSTVAGLDLGVMEFDEYKFQNSELDAEASRGLS
jgi:hypothetical protein